MRILSLKFIIVSTITRITCTLFVFSLDFVFGTVVNQSQNRTSKLKSDSIRIFVALWLFSILIITVGLVSVLNMVYDDCIFCV